MRGGEGERLSSLTIKERESGKTTTGDKRSAL